MGYIFVEVAGKLSLSPEICFVSLADMKADKAAWISIRVISETTPPRFNMEPENNGFQMDFPFPGTYFQVPC